MRKTQSIDKIFLGITALLSIVGLFVFTSASFGIVARKGFSFQDLFFDQVVLGFFLGAIIATFIVLKFPIKFLQTNALYLFIASIFITALVFVPGVGLEHGGAERWLDLKFVSFQPSEILKLGTVIYFAAILAYFKDRIGEIKYVLGLTAGVLFFPALILLLEPDTGTFSVLFFAIVAMLVALGAKFRHLFLIAIISVLALGVLAMARPYVKDRIMTFIDSSHDPLGASYQLQKSLLAIGSGGITGRGFGQSIQKFGSLPEPMGDSVFAVVGEEFGFIGGFTIIILFLLFGIRGINIAKQAGGVFESLLAVGIVILIVSQSFANIGAMLGLIPLTGVPLVFMSQGGSAVIFAIIEVGILLKISKI